MIYRLTPYAVWYFAPTFMLLALRHLHRYEFYELTQPFRLPEAVLEDVGVDAMPLSKTWMRRGPA